jgi:hypothetical protein
MPEVSKKISKEFQLSDSAVNSYGFRLLTSGYQIKEYEKNPIGYYMHLRDDGVVVKWENLRIEGDTIYGTPCINLVNKRGQQTVDEVEAGFLNGASFGHWVILDYSYDPDLMLPGQTGPTITKWYNRECSLVDVPGNYDSLCLYDADGNEINLADFSNKNTLSMKQLMITAGMLATLNLKAEAVTDAATVETAIADLAAKAAKADLLTTQLAAAEGEKNKAVSDLAAFKATTVDKEEDAILATALAAKKITAKVQAQLKADYKGRPEALKALVDEMPAYQSIAAAIAGANGADGVKDLAAKSWDDLDKAGELPALKAADLETFKAKFKTKFNKDYTGA